MPRDNDFQQSLRRIAAVLPGNRVEGPARLAANGSELRLAGRRQARADAKADTITAAADVRLHRPNAPTGPVPAMLWIPRGGHIAGTATRDDTRRRKHAVRSIGAIAAAMVVVFSAFGVLGQTSPARATTKEDVAINGTYRVTSIGNWAKLNDQYHDEPTVTAIWTVTSTCTTFQECSGTVTSDQGWSAQLYTHDGTLWYVKHAVPNWERCPDGTAYTGQQTYTFYPVESSNGLLQLGSPTLAGLDRTVGPSGACGQNKWLAIELPLRLDKLS